MKEYYSRLNITDYKGKPIANTYVTKEKPSDKIVIVFPGRNYPCYAPLLYYPTKLLFERGYDVLWVEYDYTGEEIMETSDEEGLRWFGFDAEAGYNAAMKKHKYKEVALVGKSIGTYALALLNEHHKSLKTVWLTPVLDWDDIYPKMKKTCRGSLAVIGTADPHYSKGRVDEVKKAGCDVMVVEGADHSMEFGSASESLKTLEIVLNRIDDFVMKK